MNLTNKQCDDIREKVYGTPYGTSSEIQNALMRAAFTLGMAARPEAATLPEKPMFVLVRDAFTGKTACVPYEDYNWHVENNPDSRFETYLYAREELA